MSEQYKGYNKGVKAGFITPSQKGKTKAKGRNPKKKSINDNNGDTPF